MNQPLPKVKPAWQVYAGVNEVTGEWQHVKVGPTGPADDRARRVRVQIEGRPPARWVAEFDHPPTAEDVARLDPTRLAAYPV